MRSALFVLLIVSFLNASPDKRHWKMLNKAKELEQWGFPDEARHWYKKMSKTGASPEIRYRAFQYWIDLLNSQKNEQEKMFAQEQMLEAFPRQGRELRKQLLQNYIETWQWGKMRNMVLNILRHDRPADKKKYLRLLKWYKSWTKLPIIWQEDFENKFNPRLWLMGHPYFYRSDKGEMNATTVTKSWYHCGRMFYWNGSSTSLRFDICVKKIDWTGAVAFGINSFTFKTNALVVKFGCSGGKGNLQYNFTLLPGLGKDMEVKKTNGSNKYMLNVWYRVNIHYLKEIQQARLRVRQKKDNKLIYEQIVYLPQAMPAQEYMVGFAMCRESSEHPTAFAQATVDNIIIKGKHWQKPQTNYADQDIYRINALVLQSGRKQASKECLLALKNDMKNTSLWEIMYYLVKYMGNDEQIDRETKNVLKRILELQPNHPNRDYFLRMLKNK